jgi:hypothetical protein
MARLVEEGSGARRSRAIAVVMMVLAVTWSASGAVAATTTTAAAPVDYESALAARLAKEYGDAALARSVVEGLNADARAQLEARVPIARVATSPLLSYRPPRRPARTVDSLVAFSFGYRLAPDGAITPGPTNEKLAAVTEKFVEKHPVPVFAQWEIAQRLRADGVKHVTSIDPHVGSDGKVVYLSTAGVAAEVVDRARAAGVALGQVGVIAFGDHAVRSVLTAKAAGMKAAVPRGVELPTKYDVESGQPWTRDRASWLAVDLLGRLTTL